MEIGVISDTHGAVLPAVHRALRGVDQIFHAGDIDTPDVLIELGAIAPVTAVRGNMDSTELFPRLLQQSTVSLGNSSAVVIHDQHRLRDLPKDLALVICGHTHRPLWGKLAEHLHPLPNNARKDAFILNPGCGGTRTAAPSVAILTVSGTKVSARFISLI